MNIDELIDKYEDNINNHLDKGGKRGSIQVREWRYIIKDLEQLKSELKEQHKKDVVTAVKYGIFITKSGTKTEVADKESIEYYNENH